MMTDTKPKATIKPEYKGTELHGSYITYTPFVKSNYTKKPVIVNSKVEHMKLQERINNIEDDVEDYDDDFSVDTEDDVE